MNMTRLLTIALLIFGTISCRNAPGDDRPEQHDSLSADKRDVRAAQLIHAEEAREYLESSQEKYRLVHIGPNEEYLSAHIPGALNVWRPDYTSRRDSLAGLIAPLSKVQALLRKLGVSEHTPLILYDARGGVDALRFAWTLEQYRFSNYKIVNGGLRYWQMLNFPLETGFNPYPDTGNITLDPTGSAIGLATAEEVRHAMNDKEVIIIDTRELYEFKAEPFLSGGRLYTHKDKAFGRGKIPGAIHLNWSELVDLNGDHRIKSLRDIHFDLQKKGIEPDKSFILYCQSGSRSAHSYFIFKKILNFPRVKNYDGSWIEWSYLNRQDSVRYPIEKICSQEEFNRLYAQLKSGQAKKRHIQ